MLAGKSPMDLRRLFLLTFLLNLSEYGSSFFIVIYLLRNIIYLIRDRDTVDSVGYIPKGLPFSTSNKCIRTFRHAVSLDERRAVFKTNLWKVPTEDEIKLGTKASNYDLIDGLPIKTDVEEVWFAVCRSLCLQMRQFNYLLFLRGVIQVYPLCQSKFVFVEALFFSDVGGGSVVNNTLHSLSRIPLRWMVRECFKAGTGILFYSDKLCEIGLDPSSLYPVVLPRPPPFSVDGHKIRSRSSDLIPNVLPQSKPLEEMEELSDALSPIYDQLEINKWWWVLEYLPLPLNHQEGNRKWVSKFKYATSVSISSREAKFTPLYTLESMQDVRE